MLRCYYQIFIANRNRGRLFNVWNEIVILNVLCHSAALPL
jgi:hypothetical protein